MKIFISILLTIVLMGSVSTQRITVPLSIINDQLKFPVTFGSKQCTIYVTPQLQSCTNIITESLDGTDECGSNLVGQSTVIQGGNDYAALFQLGDTQANLLFTTPSNSGQQSYYFGIKQLCFGSTGDNYYNTLSELFNEKQISEEKVFFHLNSNAAHFGDNSLAGQINIGAPNTDLIKQGSSLVTIKNSFVDNTYAAAAIRSLKLFDQSYDSRSIIYFSVTSPFTQITSFAFDNILKTFTQKGIQFVNMRDQEFTVFLPSIEQLEPIEISLVKLDNSLFTILIQPSQYTRKLSNGSYLLLLKPLFYTSTITIGYPIFESYYLGFDLPSHQILIAEKTPEQLQTNNLRGSSSLIQ